MQMKHSLFLVTLLMGAVLLSTTAHAQPVRDRVLSEVTIDDRNECALIIVNFEFPIRYLRHFPQNAGDELRIQLDPISVSPVDRDALLHRESIKPPVSEIAALAEVVYEGDLPGGPYVTLTFNHPVPFKVGQGSNFRSLVVAVPLPETKESCQPDTER